MKRLFLLLATLCLPLGLHAQKVEPFRVFESAVYGINPGMEAVLAFTPEQCAQLEKALDALKNDEAVRTAEAAFAPVKSEKTPEAAAAKGAFYKAQATANETYRAAWGSILTEDQKSLVATLNDFANEQWKQTKELNDWKARNAALREEGQKALSSVLTPAQIALLEISPAAPEKSAPAKE
jgi:hypothetical protein